MGELELGAQACLCPIVAVTGTNGKSTTTELIAAVFAAAGKRVMACGNLILFSLTLACVLWGKPTNPYLWLALGSTLALGTLGFCDDYAKVRKKTSGGLGGRQKLLVQGLVAGGVATVLMLIPQAREAALRLQIPFIRDEFLQIQLPIWGAILFFHFSMTPFTATSGMPVPLRQRPRSESKIESPRPFHSTLGAQSGDESATSRRSFSPSTGTRPLAK